MIETVGEKGYVPSTVADVVARAGVSRKAFYELYESKEACFIDAYDAISNDGMARVEDAYAQTDGGRDGVEAAIRALFEGAIEHPDSIRLAMAESTAAGPVGIERRQRLIAEYASFIRDGLESDGDGALPASTLRGVVGGLNRVLVPRMRGRQRAPLLKLVPQMTSWATSYHPAPDGLHAHLANADGDGARASSEGARKPHAPAPELLGGRAPGTLFPQPRGGKGRRASARGGGGSRSFVVHSQRTRILDAVANLTAAKGYAGLTVEDIATEAGVSLQAFYEHFESKDDAFLVAFELGHTKGLDILESAYAEQEDWRLGVRDGIAALLAYFAGEPAFTHMALTGSFIASPRALELSERATATYAQMLAPGLERNGSATRGRSPPVTVEAIAGGLTELVFDHAAHGRIRSLPDLTIDATYLLLAPFVGPEEATEIATDGAGDGAGHRSRGSPLGLAASRSSDGRPRGRRSPES